MSWSQSQASWHCCREPEGVPFCRGKINDAVEYGRMRELSWLIFDFTFVQRLDQRKWVLDTSTPSWNFQLSSTAPFYFTCFGAENARMHWGELKDQQELREISKGWPTWGMRYGGMAVKGITYVLVSLGKPYNHFLFVYLFYFYKEMQVNWLYYLLSVREKFPIAVSKVGMSI